MNKRIQLLADKAFEDASPNTWSTSDEFCKKFAQLIVAECVAICNDTNDASYLNGVIAGRKIKQHFGVEL